MAISYTSANIRTLEGALVRNKQSGAACIVGYPGYYDSSGYVQHADADLGAVQARARGVIVASKDGETSITSGDRLSLCVFGPVGGFTGMTPGQPVYLDTTVGGYTHTKPTGGAYQQSIGYAESATVLFVNPDTQDAASA
jgi:hypothetical protein